MPLEHLQNFQLPASADFHVHLRDNEVCDIVTKKIRQGGVNTVYVCVLCPLSTEKLHPRRWPTNQVMPNLVPPITTVKHALSHRAKLQKIEPNVTFLMSLYLHPSITPETIREAKKAGITGVKSYPAGVGLLHFLPYLPPPFFLSDSSFGSSSFRTHITIQRVP